MAFQRKRGTLSLVLLIILLIIFIFSIIQIIIYMYDSNKTKKLYDDLMSSFDMSEITEPINEDNNGENKARPLIDFSELKIANEDTVRIFKNKWYRH